MMKENSTIKGTGLCPFSWIEVVKPAGCLSGLLGKKSQVVSEPQLCLREACMLWDSEKNTCGLISRK